MSELMENKDTRKAVVPLESSGTKTLDEKIQSIRRVTGKINNVLFLMQVLGLVTTFSGLIVLIWLGWSLAWRVSLTGILTFGFFKMAAGALESGIKTALDKARAAGSDESVRQ